MEGTLEGTRVVGAGLHEVSQLTQVRAALAETWRRDLWGLPGRKRHEAEQEAERVL